MRNFQSRGWNFLLSQRILSDCHWTRKRNQPFVASLTTRLSNLWLPWKGNVSNSYKDWKIFLTYIQDFCFLFVWVLCSLDDSWKREYWQLTQRCISIDAIINRPFPSYLVPLFHSESLCRTFHMDSRQLKVLVHCPYNVDCKLKSI